MFNWESGITSGYQHVNIPFQRSYKVILVSGVVLINLFVIGLAFFFLNNSYVQDQRLTEVRTKNLSQVLTQSISGTINKIDLNLLSITHEIEKQLSNNKIENLPIDSILSWNKEHIQEIHRFLVLNAQGELVSGGNGSNISQKNFADRDYFSRLRDNAHEEFVISAPVLGVVGGKWVQVYARRIKNPDGTFGGIVAGSVSMEHFLKLFSSLSVGDHGSITLRDKDLAVVARYPEPLGYGSTIGQKTISKEFRELIESGITSTTYKANYPVDHIERIISYNKISDYPLYISVGMATSDLLTAWRQKVIWVLAFVSIFSILTFFSAWILNRKWKLEQQSAIKMASITKMLNKTGELARVGGWEISIAAMELYWSEQIFRIHEVNPDTTVSFEDAISYFNPDAQPIIQEAVKLLIESGASFDLELQIITAMNNLKWVRIIGEAEYLEEKIVKIFGSYQDITARKLTDIELKMKNYEIEQFIYTVSHDLRSPLVTVKTFMGYLEIDMAECNKENLSQDIQFIHSAADKMKLLLDELVEMSRVGRVETPPARVSLKEVLAETLDVLAGSVRERKIDIRLPDTDLMLFGDRQRLCQIWQNLIENALKYNRDGNIPCIEIGFRQMTGETAFFVKDNGIGIDPLYQKKIFGIFEKLDQKSSGAGMGLSLVQRIVEKSGGRVWVDSEGSGKGSCFSFTLPQMIVPD
jgi:signal transduction histidine kinase